MVNDQTVYCEEDLSLYSGKLGYCIYHFLLSQLPQSSGHHIETARALLDEISDNIDKLGTIDFGAGLAGVGWGIEWLIQNRYIEGNSDEILEELDDEIYRSVIYARSPDISLANGALGKAMYFYRRLTSQNPGANRERSLVHRECLIILMDEIYDVLKNEDNGWLIGPCPVDENTNSRLTYMAQTLIFLTKLKDAGAQPENTDKMICGITSFIYSNKHLQDHAESAGGYKYLLYALRLAGLRLKDPGWVKDPPALYERIQVSSMYPSHPGKTFFQYMDSLYKSMDGGVPVSSITLSPDNGATVFEILSSISITCNSTMHSWNEAWLLS